MQLWKFPDKNMCVREIPGFNGRSNGRCKGCRKRRKVILTFHKFVEIHGSCSKGEIPRKRVAGLGMLDDRVGIPTPMDKIFDRAIPDILTNMREESEARSGDRRPR